MLDLLDEVVTAPLTVVFAPAGSGKTSLLCAWVEERAPSAAWLSLDDSDRDCMDFWRGLAATFEAARPGAGAPALRMFRDRGDAGDIVSQLLDDLDACSETPLLLVVDDVHLVDDDPSLAVSLELFVRYKPSWLHLVVVARREPKLHLERLRARGHLGEIRFNELRFSRDEAMEMMRSVAPSLPTEAVDAALEQADGWAAGLQLAALGAQGTRTPDADDGSSQGDLLVEDYVRREVFAHETPELEQALLEVAIVDRVNPSLASAITGRVDAGELLLEAESRGLFVTRLGEGWFELHGVVRTVLRDAVSSSSHAPELHARAARWYEAAGETSLALAHWLQAGQARAALHLLSVKVAELYDRGQAEVVRRTIAAIPPSVANADVGAMFDFAWGHLLVGQPQFLVAVDQLSWLSERTTVEPPFAGRVIMLRSIAAAMICDWSACASLARQALVELGDDWRTDPVGRFGWNMVAREVAFSETWHDGHPAVFEAQHSLGADAERRVALEGTRALGDALAGRPVDALRIAAGVRRAVALSSQSILLGELAAAEALAHRELGDRDRAFTELTDLASHRIEPVGYVQLLALLDLSALHIDEGDLASAQADFDVARTLVDKEFCGLGGRTWLARLGTQLSVAGGDLEAARRWSDQIEDLFWAGASAARVALAAGDRGAALVAIETTEPRCVRHEVIRNLISSRAVENRDDAIKLAALAAESAFMNGLVQTVASEGIETLELIERTAWRVSAEWLDRLRRAAGARPSGDVSQRGLQAMLTERERDVLRFLPSRLTYPEIARELYVSVNTLKFHLKIIYRKLGVRSRTDAAEVARRMVLARDVGSSHR